MPEVQLLDAKAPTKRMYEEIVIGSSPLMMLVAREAALLGRQVLLLDDGNSLGGMWKTVTLKSGANCECACHLIEDFPQVYSYLETVTGSTFDTLDPQPERIEANGLKLKYSSRLTVSAGVAAAVMRITKLTLRSLVSPITPDQRLKLDEAKLRILDFVRFLWRKLFTGFHVAAPVWGFADFFERLTEATIASGVDTYKGHVTEIKRKGGYWYINLDEGESLTCTTVHCSASATLKPDGKGGLVSYSINPVFYLNCVAEVPLDKVVHKTGYVLFPNDPHVMRVSRIDQPPNAKVSSQLYLLQFWRNESMSECNRKEIVAKKLLKAGIIARASDVLIVEHIVGQFTPYERASQLTEGEILPRKIRESPRLRRGGTQSLTYTGVHRETPSCEPPSNTRNGETRWTNHRR